MGCWCALMRLVARSQITDYARLIALTSRATPLGFEPRITPPKGAVLPLHHGVKAAGRFTIFDGATEVATRETKNSKSRRQRSPLGGIRQPGAVALQSKSGRRCYSLGFGRRMSTVVPLP